jgi:uroporphyrinogen decarboxylase
MKPRNDWERVRMNLFLEGPADRVPLWEIHADRPVKDAFMGRPIRTPEDDAEFWVTAGYDFVPVALGLIQVGGVLGGQAHESDYSVYSESSTRQWADEHAGQITTPAELEAYPWPDPEDLDVSPIDRVRAVIPPEMGVIAITGKVFTGVWMLMGFETFSQAWHYDRGLLREMFDRVGQIQYECTVRAMDRPGVTAALMSDDIAFATALLVHPDCLREYLFPWYKKIGDAAHARGLAYVYHSDGDLTEVLDDIVACGFNGLHPIEPKAMDIHKVKRTHGDRLCLLGNIELDRLSRGTPEEVKALVRKNIREVGQDGGYCVGSSNSVTDYVPLENFKAMLEAALEQ